MKKVLLLSMIALFVSANAFSQDKKMAFGLKVNTGILWLAPDNLKELESNGTSPLFSWGGAFEYNLGDNVALVSGLEVAYTGGKLNYLDSASYLYYDDEIIEIEKDGSLSDPSDTTGAGTNYELYKLNSRSFRANYVTIPVSIKAKTNEIGYLTYFGQLGLLTQINTKGRSSDEVTSLISGTSTSQEDLIIDNEINPLKFSLQVGIGAEYNLSGSTSLVVSLNYINGLTSTVKGKSKHLIDKDGVAFDHNKVLDRGLTLGIGILF